MIAVSKSSEVVLSYLQSYQGTEDEPAASPRKWHARRMTCRKLGSTGISVSQIGMGAWQLGEGAWGSRSTEECLRMIDFALNQGCSFFDTAPGYAGGHSEEVLGRAFGGRREQVVICSKFGHTAEGRSNFEARAIAGAVEDSLRRLRTDYLDVLLLHNPPADLLEPSAPHYEEFEKLRTAGKIRAYGASVDSAEDLLKLTKTPSQVAEVLFNVFHQGARASFGDAAAAGTGLVVKVPLDSGWLSGRYNAESTFDDIRSRWSQRDIKRRSGLVDELRAIVPKNMALSEVALAFVLSYPEVATAIPGAKNIPQLQGNFSAGDLKLDPQLIEKLEQLWKTNIAPDPIPW